MLDQNSLPTRQRCHGRFRSPTARLESGELGEVYHDVIFCNLNYVGYLKDLTSYNLHFSFVITVSLYSTSSSALLRSNQMLNLLPVAALLQFTFALLYLGTFEHVMNQI